MNTISPMIVDWHDWGKDPMHSQLPLLRKIKERNPNFSGNLFCVPINCDPAFVKSKGGGEFSWLSFGVHGWQHGYNYECKDWTGGQTRYYLSKCEQMGFDKVFCAPGWQISDVVRNAILDMGWILVDRYFNYPGTPQPRNYKEAMSPHAKILLADETNTWWVHGHVQDIEHGDPRYANGMRQQWERGELDFALDTEFLLIRDLFPDVYPAHP